MISDTWVNFRYPSVHIAQDLSQFCHINTLVVFPTLDALDLRHFKLPFRVLRNFLFFFLNRAFSWEALQPGLGNSSKQDSRGWCIQPSGLSALSFLNFSQSIASCVGPRPGKSFPCFKANTEKMRRNFFPQENTENALTGFLHNIYSTKMHT